MKYDKIVEGIFVDRPNRFIAHVKINDELVTVHVKNTGRCKELLIPGVRVWLQDCNSLTRKTRYDLIAVFKEGIGIINIDSQAPNKVVKEWLEGKFDEIRTRLRTEIFENITLIKPEYTYGASRIDFYVEYNEKRALLEVKGVTLEREGIAYFPDAPTKRGVKHLNELAQATGEYETYIVFVVQMDGIDEVYPNVQMHKEFGDAFYIAKEKGVKIIVLGCHITENTITIDREFMIE